jgi:dihydrolipoamide dehydrogenase
VSDTTDVRVPDIGDFTDVPVIEIHVSPGDQVAPEDPLVTLESDKATMDVPAPAAGVVKQLRVKIGDRVSEGSMLLTLEGDSASATTDAHTPGAAPETEAPGPPSTDGAYDAELVVIGSGPGGYTAAFRAADLGLKTILIERHEPLGGVCLNVGCIPSKALLHAARVVAEAEEMSAHGIKFSKPKVDLNALRGWKQSVVDKLTGGLAGLARQRKVEVIHGSARFDGPHAVVVGDRTVSFANCIIAAGSRAASLAGLPDDPGIVDSTRALELAELPGRLLVIGGGIVGLELATVYDALGSRVTVVELLEQLLPGCDPDLVKPLHARIAGRYEAIHLATKVESVKRGKEGLQVHLSNREEQAYDQVLVAVGRHPNGHEIGAVEAGVEVDDAGFISVDAQLRTNVPHIYAIGDITGPPMLAHRASHQGKAAAEVIAGHDVAFNPRAVPAVAYTDPEVAWMGLTEQEARAQGIEYEKGVFPWSASGRALSLGRDDGITKLLFESGSRRLLGAGITGIGAGELIAETVHALELGADAEDIALTVHPHPTLTETLMFAAELAQGTITDLLPPRQATAGDQR